MPTSKFCLPYIDAVRYPSMSESVGEDDSPSRSSFSSEDVQPFLERLNPIERDTLDLSLAGSREVDIARLMGVSQPAISQRLTRIRRRLASWMGHGSSRAPRYTRFVQPPSLG